MSLQLALLSFLTMHKHLFLYFSLPSSQPRAVCDVNGRDGHATAGPAQRPDSPHSFVSPVRSRPRQEGQRQTQRQRHHEPDDEPDDEPRREERREELAGEETTIRPNSQSRSERLSLDFVYSGGGGMN